MGKMDIFKYEEQRLKNVIALINNKIKYNEELFNKQKNTIIGVKEAERGAHFTRQGLMSLYATEIYDLKSVLSNPYFGMFEFESSRKKNEIYLGRKAITDGTNVIAHDWRSPVCSMYYDYSIGNAEYISNSGEKIKGQINKKRQIIIKDGILKDVDEQDTLSNDTILLKYLKENSDARLKSIIATIQKEQNKIIRSPLMNKINSKNLYTDRLELRIPTMEEQHRLWEILINEDINQYYFPTPDRIFDKNNLSKDNIEDLKKARRIFTEQLSDWERQEPFYEKKIESIQAQDDSQKYTWSIFLKGTNTVIGQITCQPKDNEPENIRDVGWFIDPNC